MTPNTTPPAPHFAQALTLLFIAYQLAGLIAWPWALVVSPLIAHYFAAKIVAAFSK